MALQSTGPIKFSDINVELSVAANTPRKLSDSVVRTLFSVASGTIRLSNGYGKSNRISVTVTLAANTTNYTLNTAQIPGYAAGTTDVTLVVNSGVYVYSTNVANAGLTVAALAAGDTVAIVNNGFIMGKGGNGGAGRSDQPGTTYIYAPAENGGPAMSISRSVNITNNSYIAGGGGGGGAPSGKSYVPAGGGAGGGNGAWDGIVVGASSRNYPGLGGAPGQSGGNSTLLTNSSDQYYSGGGGGRILPGVGGGPWGGGGGAGGAGGGYTYLSALPGSGGSANNPGGNSSGTISAGAGGGGWGAVGGNNLTYPGVPGAGGKAVNLNGFTATFLATGTRYGAIA